MPVSQKEKDEIAILANPDFGATVEDRQARFQKAKVVAGALNVVGMVNFFLLIFYPKPYALVTGLSIVLPFFIVSVMHIFNGLIKIDKVKGSAYPSTVYAVVYPAIGLGFRAVFDFQILSYDHFWLPAICITVGTLLILLATTLELSLKRPADWLTTLFVAAFIFVYAYGGVLNYNCFYDQSETETYMPEVLAKRERSGRGTSYYLELAPWGPRTERKEVKASRELYQALEVGDQVKISMRQGKMDIPWFEVSTR
ncbi:MAG: hypothetical protein AAGA85_18810 [Bacteroidota bacterium]